MSKHGLWIFIIGFILVTGTMFISCQKEITVDLPTTPARIVVEGSIEQGLSPIVVLSWSQGYFQPSSINDLGELYIQGADVQISDGTDTYELDELCISELPGELLPQVAEATGFSVETLMLLDLCAYVSLNNAIMGEVGKTYQLTVEYQGEHLETTSKLNNLVYLDSLWFEVTGTSDSLGFAYAILTDPDTLGNAYRWFAKRINHYPDWSPDAGEQKDRSYIAPLGSTYDDEFFNGLSFEFAYYRGVAVGSTKDDDFNEERGFFKVGDTIAVKGAVIDRNAFHYISSFEDQIASQGTPFSAPANISSNVIGGLGAFIAYGAVYDTIVCTP